MPQQNAEVIARRFGAAGQRFLRELPERLADISGRWQLVVGEPLHRYDAQAIVMGAHGHGRVAVILGGTSRDVVRNADAPWFWPGPPDGARRDNARSKGAAARKRRRR